jgi:Fur family transcriptional regulator, ferric uptake regulator
VEKLCAATIIREYGLKHTAGREALLHTLIRADQPLSHKEICDRLEGTIHYDPVSIYRSLETFISSGIVHRIEGDNRTWLFAVCTCREGNHCHPHFFCRSCGKSECLKDLQMPGTSGLEDSYLVEEKRFYLKGVCKSCATHIS